MATSKKDTEKDTEAASEGDAKVIDHEGNEVTLAEAAANQPENLINPERDVNDRRFADPSLRPGGG